MTVEGEVGKLVVVGSGVDRTSAPSGKRIEKDDEKTVIRFRRVLVKSVAGKISLFKISHQDRMRKKSTQSSPPPSQPTCAHRLLAVVAVVVVVVVVVKKYADEQKITLTHTHTDRERAEHQKAWQVREAAAAAAAAVPHPKGPRRKESRNAQK